MVENIHNLCRKSTQICVLISRSINCKPKYKNDFSPENTDNYNRRKNIMTKYEIAQKIRELLDMDLGDMIEAALELAQILEDEDEDEYD